MGHDPTPGGPALCDHIPGNFVRIDDHGPGFGENGGNRRLPGPDSACQPRNNHPSLRYCSSQPLAAASSLLEEEPLSFK
jgi:hypothetical protein